MKLLMALVGALITVFALVAPVYAEEPDSLVVVLDVPGGGTETLVRAIDEIDGYAFHAKMIPAGESAHGFVYFQIGHRPGSQIYVRGIVEAPTGKELLFFEIPMD